MRLKAKRLKKLSIKKPAEKFMKEELFPMPQVLTSRFNKLVLIGAGAAIAGATLCIMSIGSGQWLTFAMSFGLLSAGMLTYAFLYRRSIQKNGYFAIRGVVTFVKMKAMKIGKEQPIYYRIKTPDEKIYQIPVFKDSLEVSQGSEIIVYMPHNYDETVNSGVIYLTSIYGFELAGEGTKETL